MRRASIKNQLVIFLVVTALFALGLYIAHSVLPPYVDVNPTAMQESENNMRGAVLLLLWAGLALVFVRALITLLFGLLFYFRRRYKAPTLIRTIISIVIYIVCFAFIFKHFFPTVGLGGLFTTSAVLGAILGLALQDTLGNLFAGISTHADKPFQVGDVVTVGQKTGVVESITWRAVKIRTFTNHIVLISHSTAAKESIEVCPRDNLNARIVFFNALYTDSPAKTIHIVREAVREADNVSQEITPIVRIRNFGDSSVDWEVKYWLIDYAKFNDTDALVRQRIWYAFRRAGLNFAFPTRTVYVQRPSKHDAAQADGRGYIERLSAVDIFAPLTMDETAKLAGNAVSHVFAPGETVIRAGDKGASMFVVHNGRVKVQISDNGTPRTVATLNEGDFFGEMALFTGEPRTANVVAIEETEVLEIGYQAMKHLFDTNPDLVDSLSYIIAERRTGLDAKRDLIKPDGDESAGIISAIKQFFGFA